MRDEAKEFDLEHAISEDQFQKNLGVLEYPLTKRVLRLFFAVALMISGAAAVKLFALTGWEGEFYKNRAEMNVAQTITIPAARGLIYDRFGNLLAEDEPSHRAVLNVILAKHKGINLEETLTKLSELLVLDKTELQTAVSEANLEKTALIALVRNLSDYQVNLIKEAGIDGIEIQDDYRRQYLKGPAFSHILGYTGLAKFNDVAGKTGLEKHYDGLLGGTDGVRLVYRDAKRNILDEKLLDVSKNGEQLYTTIDSGLQEYFYNRLQGALRALGREAAVGIALNPQNGEVLALINLPSFDNNVFTDAARGQERARLLNSVSEPLFNRAVSGVYAPGSTIKPLVALAALNEGVVNPEKEIFSAGFIEIPNPYFPEQPSRFLDWKPHGWVNLHSALARSSNVYFYAVGGGFGDIKGLGIEKLKEYWELFGLGSKTGIDLAPENTGFLPDPGEKEKRVKDIWRLGDTYNTAIGQGDLLVTPIQLINYIASIANGGNLYKPHFAKGIGYRVEGKDLIQKEFQPEVLMNFSDMGEYVKEVQKGMEDAVSKWYGTANLLADLPVTAAGKTGSAQIANNTKTNAFFVGYLPVEALAKAGVSLDKQIAILVLIENAREGSLNAVPVGRDVLEWYYWNRLIK